MMTAAAVVVVNGKRICGKSILNENSFAYIFVRSRSDRSVEEVAKKIVLRKKKN